MKQRKKKEKISLRKVLFIFAIMLATFLRYPVYATETEVMESQKESLNISDFIKQAEDYTKDTFQDIDFNALLESAMTGKVENQDIYQKVISLLGSELKDTLKTFRSNSGCYCYSQYIKKY